jgi:hypothetical protein
MSDESLAVPRFVQRFFDNRTKVPPERLAEHAGRYVAWSLDGSRLLAAADSEEALRQTLLEQAINPSLVVYEFVEKPAEMPNDQAEGV